MLRINFMSNKLFTFVTIALILINIIFITLLLKGDSFKGTKGNYPELSAINNSNMNFNELSKFFNDLAKEKGGRYAFEVLKVAQLGPNIDLHLLGHFVGDVLYKQEGADGITACDNDFRNACSHSIVIGLFNDKGENALSQISNVCRKAPGGSGAYTMCFHGLGHGILAYENYDMKKASEICQKTGTAEYNYSEGAQCISGTVMEIIGGGFHDKELWQIQREKYLNKNQPLALCQSSFIPENSKTLCYEYLTPYFFEAVGANLAQPTAQDFKKAFQYCKQLPEGDSNRNTCFAGFGKEFGGLVQSRDIRQDSINNISSSKLKQISDWCLLADDTKGTESCIVDAMNSLYWGGENDRGVSIRFCSEVTDSYFQKSCFSALTLAVSYYIKDTNYRESYCKEIPVDYQSDCQKILKP